MREHNFHRLFEASVTLKGIHALLELITGAATLAVGPVAVSDFFYALAQREWLGGGRGWVVNFLVRLADQSLRGGQEFVGIYLLVIGTINLILVIGLFARALWAYPAALTAIALLMAYQLYRYTHTHVSILILLTLYDGVVWWLVRHEYRFVRWRALMERQSSKSSTVSV
jgi:uncharacterized membrane protein